MKPLHLPFPRLSTLSLLPFPPYSMGALSLSLLVCVVHILCLSAFERKGRKMVALALKNEWKQSPEFLFY